MNSLVLASVLFTVTAAEPPRDKLRLGAAWRLWGRNFQLVNVDPGFVPLSSVDTLPTGATLDVQWFPATYFVDDLRAEVGVTLRADFAAAYTTVLDDARFDSHAMRLRTGLMFRMPFRYLEPSVHLGLHAFEATTALGGSNATPRPRLPNVTYLGPRVGVAARLLEFWRITFDAALGLVWLTSFGELSSAAFFPNASGFAWDANVGLAFRTWAWLDLRLGVDVTGHEVDLGHGGRASDAYYGVSFGIVFKGVP